MARIETKLKGFYYFGHRNRLASKEGVGVLEIFLELS